MIGHSPAILTETLAAQTQAGRIPDTIRVISTVTGASLLSDVLFAQGGWSRFLSEYPECAGIEFGPADVSAPAEIDDIRTESENRAMAEVIFGDVSRLIGQFDYLDASIAGGRKTMGYYLGLAMSLLGRPGDSMTHVLVPPEWEKDRSFLFPARADAPRIDLIQVPFLRFGPHLKLDLGKLDPDALMASAQGIVDMAAKPAIGLHVRPREVEFLSKRMQLNEREFSILQFFVQQKTKHCRRPELISCGICTECFLSIKDIDIKKEELTDVRMQFGGVDNGNYQRFVKAWKIRNAAQDNLPEPLRRIAEAIQQSFGIDPRAESLLVKNIGKRGEARYGVLADKSQLRIERE